MAKFATSTKSRGTLLGTTGEKTSTHEGGTGFVREPQAELYLAAVSTTLEPTFYESASDREGRLVSLVHQVTNQDPEWVLRFVEWLRAKANMRSVSIVVAAEFAKARLDAGEKGMSRRAITAACLRADEPGEFIAYWQSRHGRNLPMPVKRGLADAARKLYTERSALRYDGGSGAMRLGDVIELVHPSPVSPTQSALFGWLLDRRHGRRETPAADLGLLNQVTARATLGAASVPERHEFVRQVLAGDPTAEATWIKALAGQWEWGKSWLGQETEDRTFERVSQADQWKLFVEYGMGYMALLRNLRNMDEAKISEDLVKHVKAVLASEDEVKRSRQFPFRFWSAYKATQGNHWADALSQGLEHSLANVPSLDGHTLILADMSGSMWPWGRSEGHTTFPCELAALFGSAVALRAERATLVQYGSGSTVVKVDKSQGVLKHMGRFTNMGGTATMQAVRDHFKAGEHTRLIIVTDEQAHYDSLGGGLDTLVPQDVHCYTWNVGGYRAAHAESGPTRHSFGGLTDQSWGLIPLIEAGVEQNWPF